jgi:hypothetical protein
MAEQMSAQQQLGGVLQGARGQDIGNEQFNAGWTNNNNLSQAQLLMQQRQLNDNYGLGLRGLELQNGGGHVTPGNTLGTQFMSGGGQALAMYGTQGMGAYGPGGSFGGEPPMGPADRPPTGGPPPSTGPGSPYPYSPKPW